MNISSYKPSIFVFFSTGQVPSKIRFASFVWIFFGRDTPTACRNRRKGKTKIPVPLWNCWALRITGPCYGGVWLCIAGVWDLQTISFEITWFVGSWKKHQQMGNLTTWLFWGGKGVFLVRECNIWWHVFKYILLVGCFFFEFWRNPLRKKRWASQVQVQIYRDKNMTQLSFGQVYPL